MKQPLSLWLEGTRPNTLIAILSPVAIGTIITWGHRQWSLVTWLATLCSALLIQIGTNFANDYLDAIKGADTADRRGPRRLASSNLVSIRALKIATALCFGLAALVAVYLTLVGGYPIAILAIVAISCGFFYTGGPYPLAYLGLGDLFVFVFFGPVATAGTAYLQTGVFSSLAALAGIAPGLLATALLTANNLRDEASDRRAGKKTIPVRFGKKVGQVEYLCCLVGAALTPVLLVTVTTVHTPLLLASAFLLFARPAFTILAGQADLSLLLPETAKLLAAYTLLFLFTWLLASP
ncbi:MAG: 1,4-dihydroxy-2-naphthoate octaprenyltransferase [Chlamydiota bacterium]